MLKTNSIIRLDSLSGAIGLKEYEKFIGKNAIVLRKENYDNTSYIVDIDGDELLINLEYDEVYNYETKEKEGKYMIETVFIGYDENDIPVYITVEKEG